MPSYKTAFGSFLKTEDLQGRAVPVVIEVVELVTIKGQDGKPDERKLAAHFRGKDKALVLNKTRCEQLEDIFDTDDYEQWAGPVMLVPGETKFGGKTVGCVNIEARRGAVKPMPVAEPEPEPAPVTDDDIPFAWMMPLVLPSLFALGSVLA